MCTTYLQILLDGLNTVSHVDTEGVGCVVEPVPVGLEDLVVHRQVCCCASVRAAKMASRSFEASPNFFLMTRKKYVNVESCLHFHLGNHMNSGIDPRRHHET